MIYKLHKPSKIHSNGDGYITRSGHTMFNEDIIADLNRVKQLEAENIELKKTISKLLSDLAESDNKTGAREAGLEKENAELKANWGNLREFIGEMYLSGEKVNKYHDHYNKEIEIMQDHKITKMTKVRILKSAIIPSFAGSCICSICKDDIEDDTQTVFDVPYHSEYAHTKCFKEATK